VQLDWLSGGETLTLLTFLLAFSTSKLTIYTCASCTNQIPDTSQTLITADNNQTASDPVTPEGVRLIVSSCRITTSTYVLFKAVRVYDYYQSYLYTSKNSFLHHFAIMAAIGADGPACHSAEGAESVVSGWLECTRRDY
jgi:hypothetical protein